MTRALGRSSALILLLTVAALTANAYPRGGGGGIEYYTNLDASVLTRMGVPAEYVVDLPAGSIYGVGGFGYGIDRHGLKIGGFGMSLFTDGHSFLIPNTNTVVDKVVGGVGGVISGAHGRIGPVDLSLNCRLGVGGMAITTGGTVHGSYPTTWGVVALYGSLDAEIGVHFFPAMMVSVFGGVDGFVPVGGETGLRLLPAPIAGVRLTWGSF